MQVTRMKAVYVNEAHRLEIVDLPKPEITRDDDVLIRITSAGICSSDLEIAAGVHPFARYPMIIGHEFGGIVEQVGAGVTHVAAGDRVTVDPVTSCGKCHSCLRGKPNVCLHLATMGVHRDGGFAEYAVVPEKNVYVFRKPGIDPSILGLAEPYSIGVQTNFRGGTRKGDRVMVLGAGPIGICAMQEARWRGAEVAITDLLDSRLQRAAAMGADHTINAGETDPAAWCQAQYGGDGADVVINTVGNAASLAQSIQLAAFGGTIVSVSLDKRPAPISQAEITKKELTIAGSRLNLHHFGHVVEAIESGAFQPELLRSHTFHFTEIRKALALIREHPELVSKVALSFD